MNSKVFFSPRSCPVHGWALFFLITYDMYMPSSSSVKRARASFLVRIIDRYIRLERVESSHPTPFFVSSFFGAFLYIFASTKHHKYISYKEYKTEGSIGGRGGTLRIFSVSEINVKILVNTRYNGTFFPFRKK